MMSSALGVAAQSATSDVLAALGHGAQDRCADHQRVDGSHPAARPGARFRRTMSNAASPGTRAIGAEVQARIGAGQGMTAESPVSAASFSMTPTTAWTT